MSDIYGDYLKKKTNRYLICCGVVCIGFAIAYLFAGSGSNVIFLIILAIVCITIGVKGEKSRKGKKCPKCGIYNLKAARSCMKCSYQFSTSSPKTSSKKTKTKYVNCVRCGGQSRAQDEFCSHCGARLDEMKNLHLLK